MSYGPLSSLTLRTRPIGRTEDFCPVCRRACWFTLSEAEHCRYFLVFAQGRHGHPWHELECTQCGARLEREVGERKIDYRPESKVEAERYEPESLPLVGSRIKSCESMERGFCDGSLKPNEREEMLRTAFFSFAKLYEEDLLERVPPVLLTAMAVMSLGLVATGVVAWQRIESQALLIGVLASVFVLILVMLLFLMSHSPRHRVRGWIAAAAAPLNPTEAEVIKFRRELQTQRLRAGYRIQTKKLLKRMHQERKRQDAAIPKPPAGYQAA